MNKKYSRHSFYGKEKPGENISPLTKKTDCNAWCTVKSWGRKGLETAGDLLETGGAMVSLFAPEVGEPMMVAGLAAKGFGDMIPEEQPDPFNPKRTRSIKPPNPYMMDIEADSNTQYRKARYTEPIYKQPLQGERKPKSSFLRNSRKPMSVTPKPKEDVIQREYDMLELAREARTNEEALTGVKDTSPLVIKIGEDDMDGYKKITDPKEMTNRQWLEYIEATKEDPYSLKDTKPPEINLEPNPGVKRLLGKQQSKYSIPSQKFQQSMKQVNTGFGNIPLMKPSAVLRNNKKEFSFLK